MPSSVFDQGETMSNIQHHVNQVILIGKVIQTWKYDDNIVARLSMRRPVFLPIRDKGPQSDLVSVVLPNAVTRGQVIENEMELHIVGFIRSEDREAQLSSLIKDVEIPRKLQGLKVRQIVTEVVALDWQVIR